MKTATELFNKHTIGEVYMRQFIFVKALTEHDNEIKQLMEIVILKHRELAKLFPCEANENGSSMVEAAVNKIIKELGI